MNRWMLLNLLIMLNVIFNIFLSPFITVTVGLLLVFAAGEPVVDGFKGLAQYTGFPEHVIGIVSSIASNLPEAVLTLFMIFSPDLREVAILTVMLASAFNGLLLGLLIIMLTFKGGVVELPREVMKQDVEIMRITIILSVMIFGTGLILNIFHGESNLPFEASIFLLIAYLSYLYFIFRRFKGEVSSEIAVKGWVKLLILGLIGIIVSGDLLSSSLEFFVRKFNVHIVVAATLISFAGRYLSTA